MSGRIAAVDAAKQQTYVPGMRRSVRSIFFPAPLPEFRPLAERLLRDATQSGVLDFPALVHAPIEKWLVSHLCRTTITPNQITLGTGVLGLVQMTKAGKGEHLDDFSRFDRLVRSVAGRRNIYTWLFTFCLMIGARQMASFGSVCGEWRAR